MHAGLVRGHLDSVKDTIALAEDTVHLVKQKYWRGISSFGSVSQIGHTSSRDRLAVSLRCRKFSYGLQKHLCELTGKRLHIYKISALRTVPKKEPKRGVQ